MRDKIINIIEEDIKNTKAALKTGKFSDVFDDLKEKDVTDEIRETTHHVISYLEKYLLPKIKELNE